MGLLTRLRFLLRRVQVSDYSKFSIGVHSGVGSYSRILFSSYYHPAENQSISIGNHAGVGMNCELHVWNNNHIEIKDHATLNDGCKLLGDVTIEKYCLLSANIFASSGNHYAFEHPGWLIKDQDKKILSTEEGKKAHSQPIHIEEDCWIGYGVFIKRGIYIGRGAVIGANSVVLANVAPYSVQGGIPCKEIRKRFVFEPPIQLMAGKDEHLPYFYRGFEHKRQMLESSGKQHHIQMGSAAIAVLQSVNGAKGIRIRGKRAGSSETELLISLQDAWQWNVAISTEEFEIDLAVQNASRPVQMNKALFEGLPNELRQYSIVCFATERTGSLAISQIQLSY